VCCAKSCHNHISAVGVVSFAVPSSNGISSDCLVCFEFAIQFVLHTFTLQLYHNYVLFVCFQINNNMKLQLLCFAIGYYFETACLYALQANSYIQCAYLELRPIGCVCNFTRSSMTNTYGQNCRCPPKTVQSSIY
jgi:hypothetical protein